jgi:uncharacterized RDD family membrane protein YckC
VSADPAPQAYAGIVTRAIAFVIDALIINTALIVLSACVALVLSVLVPEFEAGTAGIAAGFGAWGLFAAAYFIGFWTLTGQTAGMRVLGLRVTDGSGARLRPGRAVIRVAGMWLAALPLMAGYALILFDRRRQGLHDKLARTFVCHVAAAVDAGVHAPAMAHPRAPLPSSPPRDNTAGDLSIDAEERLA